MGVPASPGASNPDSSQRSYSLPQLLGALVVFVGVFLLLWLLFQGPEAIYRGGPLAAAIIGIGAVMIVGLPESMIKVVFT
jgi:hypothetical protein